MHLRRARAGQRRPRARRARPSTSSTTSARGTRRAHKPILCIEGLGVGLGARPFADGVDVIYYIAQENYPVEYVERDFPLRVERYAVRPDSGGPGYHRGGTGVVRDVRVLCERAELATRMENTVVAPYGVAGGARRTHGPRHAESRHPGRARAPARSATASCVKRGDVLRFETCGGGGWGDPLTRDPDARVGGRGARLHHARAARSRTTAWCWTPQTLEPDKTATEAERARRAGTPALIDRGPGSSEAEARWRAARSG